MSPIAGGLSAQFGMVDESVFNTLVTVTRFLEFTDESLAFSIERIESKGLRPLRRVLNTADWVAGRQGGSGDVNMEVNNQGMGLVLKHMMGSIASSQPSVGTAPTVWEHKATVGPLDGKSFTAQIGRTGSGGTTTPFTYGGCKIAAWELDCDNQGILMLKLTLDTSSETTATALATATYATASVPLVYTGGAITVGGTATPIEKISLTGNNGLKTDRYFMQATNAANKSEQLEGSGIREYGGSIDAEFTDTTLYNKFKNGTVGALTAFFTGANIATTFNFALEVTCAAVRFDGSTPNVGGPDIIQTTFPIKVLDSGAADGPMALVYRTVDVTP